MKNNWPDNITIQQYLQGTLDKELMHELEKRALDDPFLSDAIEGYNLISEPDHGLSILQRQLHKRIMLQQENKKVFDLSWQRLSVAAAAAVMFISAGVLFWMNSQIPDQQLASNSKQVEVQVTAADSLKREVREARTSVAVTDKDQLANLTSAKKSPIPTSKPERKSSEVEASNDVPTLKPNNEGLVAGNGNARVAAIQQIPQNSSLDSKVHISDSAQTKARAVQVDNIPNWGVSRFSAKSSNLRTGNSAEALWSTAVLALSAQPVDGWESYRLYLQDEVAKTATVSTQKGKVIIGFNVDTKGKLNDFKIIKSLSIEVDSVAIKIIRTGPVWKAAVNKQKSSQEIELDF